MFKSLPADISLHLMHGDQVRGVCDFQFVSDGIDCKIKVDHMPLTPLVLKAMLLLSLAAMAKTLDEKAIMAVQLSALELDFKAALEDLDGDTPSWLKSWN